MGSVGRPLSFPQLAGEEGYRRAVREVYDTLEVSSLTWAPCVCNVPAGTGILDLRVSVSAQRIPETLDCHRSILLSVLWHCREGPASHDPDSSGLHACRPPG